MKKVLLSAVSLAFAVSAHMEVIYTPQTEVADGKDAEFSIFFSHPFEGGPLMEHSRGEDLAVKNEVKSAFIVHKGEKTDIKSELKPVQYTAGKSKAGGFDYKLTGSAFRSAGDYAVVIEGFPYYEPEEGLYIQQITKLFVNKGFSDDSWKERLCEGLAEIIPLNSPYGVTAGSIFRAKVVDNDGKAVTNAQVEVEYLNYPIDMKKHTFGGAAKITNEKKGTATLVTDDNGVFAFVPSKSGYWGFAVLFGGSDKEYNGKEREQDPVIWIQAGE